MGDQSLLWTKLSAIGQIAGAAATFLAVGVSLWLARGERRQKLRVRCGMRLSFIGDGTPPTRHIGWDIVNIGLRPAIVGNIGWYTARFRFGPIWIDRKAAIQNWHMTIGPNLPVEIPPGDRRSVYQDAAEFNEANKEGNSDFFLRKRLLSKKPRLAQIYTTVFVTGRPPIIVKPEKEFLQFIRDATLLNE